MSKPLVLNNEIRKRLKEEMKLIYEITKAIKHATTIRCDQAYRIFCSDNTTNFVNKKHVKQVKALGS